MIEAKWMSAKRFRRYPITGVMCALLLACVFLGSAQPEYAIVYEVFDDYTLYLKRLAPNKPPQLIVETTEGGFSPSPDGGALLFSQRRDGTIEHGHVDLYLADMDRGDVTRLTETGNNYAAVWSPAGDKIAFVSGEEDHYDIYWIYAADVAASAAQVPLAYRLTDLDRSMGSLAWSPDGSKLAFVVGEGIDDGELFVMNADGTDLISLTDSFADAVYEITWSPDGEQIAFTASKPERFQESDIYLVSLKTRTPIRLSRVSAEYPSLAWSPTDPYLAYTSDLGGGWDIYRMDVRTSEQVNLTADSGLQDGVYGLDWSPSGAQIVYDAGPIEGNFQIFVMDADGSNRVQITSEVSHAIEPLWAG
jgi:Tol biopolymer transport system component